MVFFTCFVQGTTIKSLVRLLNIRLQGDKDENFTSHIQMSVMDDIMAGIEILAGRSGHYRFGRRFNEFEKKFINRYLLVPNSSVNDSLENVLEHHYTNLYAPTIIAKVTTKLLTSADSFFFAGDFRGERTEGAWKGDKKLLRSAHEKRMEQDISVSG